MPFIMLNCELFVINNRLKRSQFCITTVIVNNIVNVAGATFALFIENEASMGIEIFDRDFQWNFIKS